MLHTKYAKRRLNGSTARGQVAMLDAGANVIVDHWLEGPQAAEPSRRRSAHFAWITH